MSSDALATKLADRVTFSGFGADHDLIGVKCVQSRRNVDLIRRAYVPVILCGHTHLQRAMTLDDGRMTVNTGSVGLPAYDDDRPHAHLVESGSPHARYAILSKEGDG